jgi:Fe-Mn family superoxide dismutase
MQVLPLSAPLHETPRPRRSFVTAVALTVGLLLLGVVMHSPRDAAPQAGFAVSAFPLAASRAPAPAMKLEGEHLLLSRFGLPSEQAPGQGGQVAMDRRSAVGLAAATAAAAALGGGPAPAMADGMFAVPPLPYAYNALEPHVDEATMKFHHDFHHQAYVTNLNKAMADKPKASLASLMKDAKANKINNAGGGHYNHCLFWESMGPKGGGAPTGAVAEQINKAFGSYDEFKAKFAASAAGVFGSGWAWLAVGPDGAVKILTTPNQDNPLMDSNGDIPILGIDVWEHAYYLKYQNRRPEYIQAWFNVVNWDKVNEFYEQAAKGKAVEFA